MTLQSAPRTTTPLTLLGACFLASALSVLAPASASGSTSGSAAVSASASASPSPSPSPSAAPSPSPSASASASASDPIDAPTLDAWSAPYRGWHYWPEHVIPAQPRIPGHERFENTDVPCVYQLPGRPDTWFMSFIAFDGRGYNSFVAESTDLVRWTDPRLAMGFGPPGEFDHGGRVIGAFLYESYDIRAPRVLERRDGRFWTLYGCYPRQGGYELRPGYEGVATSDDGLSWRRAKDAPILSVHDPDCGAWEKDCIYQPWLVRHRGRFFNFYNAADGGTEQTGLAFSTDLLSWMRYPANPVVPVRAGGYDAQFASDPKVFRDGDHWTMFYFGVGRGGAHIMIAFSRDLVSWTAHPEPLYRAGGHPGELDRQYAHKISLVFDPADETFYMHYCATGAKGRGIGLLTSKPLAPRAVEAPAKEAGEADGHRRGTRFLFIDGEHVEEMRGVERVFHRPVKERGPVVVPDRPWERDGAPLVELWTAPIWSEERSRWQMWYIGGDVYLPLYAESADGLKWDKPSLGLVDWKGSSDNNIVSLGFESTGKANRFVLVRDDREADPARRYKGLTLVDGALRPLVSADGLSWKLAEGDSIPAGDEYRLGLDPVNRRFVATVKQTGLRHGWDPGERPLSEFGRRVFLCLSDDFVRWTEPRLILWGDELDRELGGKRIEEAVRDPDLRAPLVFKPDELYTDIYNMAVFPYEDLYLGLPVVFHQSGRHEAGNQDGILSPSLALSRDLIRWDRPSRERFIPPSRLSDDRNWDYGGNCGPAYPTRRGDELWFYYSGTRFTHLKRSVIEEAGLRKSPDEPMRAIFLARSRIDGFASLHAGREPGSVLTAPVEVTGPRLHVNVDARGGELRVEILDAERGEALPGRAMGGDAGRDAAVAVREDAARAAIRWRGGKDLSELRGRRVRLRFSLRGAHLYSFWFEG